MIHVLVMIFGLAMAYNGSSWASPSRTTRSPTSNLPEVVRYVPLVLSGVLIALFSIEHIIALRRGQEVEPAWH